MSLVAMLVVGISAGQLAWAMMPETASISWLSVSFLGILGSLLGGVLTSIFIDAANIRSGFHPMGIIGSVAGTLVLVGLLHVVRRVTF